MKTFLTLVKTNLNINFGISALKYRFIKEKKRRWEPILIGLAILSGLGPFISLYTLIMYGVFTAGVSLNHPEIVITVSFVIGQLFVLFFGIFYVMGAFYFSKDMNLLIPLPLQPYEVLGSKLAVVMINEYLTLFPLLLPPVIIYGSGLKMGFLYWLKSIMLILASPVIPLTVGSLLVVVIMRFVNVRKNKDLFTIIGGFVGLFLVLGMNLLFQQVPKQNSEELIREFLAGQAGLIEAVGRKFPPAIWATFSLSKPELEGFGYFMLFMGVSVVLSVFLLWLANRVFYKGLISGQEVAGRRKVLTSDEVSSKYRKSSSPVAAIFSREWKLLLRTPVYVLNGLTGAIMGPFMVVLLLVIQGQDEGTRKILSFAQKPEYALFVTLAGLALALFTAGMNAVASTAVSREGQTFWIAKIIPVTPGQQVLAKLLNGLLVSVLGVLSTGLILSVVLKLTLYRILIIVILGIAGSIPMSAISLMIDILHPKLQWSSPQEAMKQNINGLFGMIASVLFLGVLALAAVISINSGMSEWAIYFILLLLTIVISVPALTGLFALAKRQYAKYEV